MYSCTLSELEITVGITKLISFLVLLNGISSLLKDTFSMPLTPVAIFYISGRKLRVKISP